MYKKFRLPETAAQYFNAVTRYLIRNPRIFIVLVCAVIVTGAYWQHLQKMEAVAIEETDIADLSMPPLSDAVEYASNDANTQPEILHFTSTVPDAHFEAVGLDASGNMKTPQDVMGVSWLDLGVIPGQKGTAVIAGHYDKKDLSPAVFYKLNEIKVGDTFDIEYQDGSKRIFEVYDVADEPVSPELAEKVFDAQTDETHVNLITCSGIWNKDQKMYTQRYVVYAKMKT